MCVGIINGDIFVVFEVKLFLITIFDPYHSHNNNKSLKAVLLCDFMTLVVRFKYGIDSDVKP